MAVTDIRIKIGLRIKELRDSTGMSQEKFAYSIGMARSYFAEVETGKRNVSVENLEKISLGLGVSLDVFFDSNLFRDSDLDIKQNEASN